LLPPALIGTRFSAQPKKIGWKISEVEKLIR
jgi:hypothetical protein